MLLPTPFHPRTSGLSYRQEWRDWSGYLAAGTYEYQHDREYYAIRQSAALIDVSPLFKYDLRGRDALRAADRIVTRDLTKARLGQIMYSPWCDDDGKMIDDGTVWRVAEDHIRITAADPSLRWFQDVAAGLEVEIHDVSDEIAALALQGPASYGILQALIGGEELSALRYYHLMQTQPRGIPLTITRTGYTGDLGYELWVRPLHAVKLWDALMEVGEPRGLTPCGIIALDIARIEAGLIMIDVDYISAHKALTEEQKSSPFEAGLGWAVALDGGDFIGKRALVEEKRRDARWSLAGVEADWDELEGLYARAGLPPQVAGRASRVAVPAYAEGVQVGQVTSHTFSPLLKKYIGLASLRAPFARPGTGLEIEFTVEYVRHRARAVVRRLPFFDPPRKRARFDA